MSKITLDLNSFKALASETRLDILRALDGKKMSLNELSEALNLNKATIHEHLMKLYEAGLIKRKEREGHKWVYYKLSWKGASLLHPDNTKIVILLTITIVSLIIGTMGFINYIEFSIEENYEMGKDSMLSIKDNNGNNLSKGRQTYDSSHIQTYNPILLILPAISTILFLIFFIVTIWVYYENKEQKL